MSIFKKIYELEKENKTFAIATLIETDGSTPRNDTAKMIITSEGVTYGTVGGGAMEQAVIKESLKCIKENKTEILDYNLDGSGRDNLKMICGGKAKVFIDVINAEPLILLVGGGHINLAISKYIDILNYRYVVIDNLEKIANENRFPNAFKIINKDFIEGIEELKLDEKYIVIVATRGHEHDYECIEKVLETDVSYIGMIGSKKKVATTFKRLAQNGYKDKIGRIYAPIGLDIGTETPEEIALSIVAEILKVKSESTGKSLRDNFEVKYEI
ncbi:MAG: XdhC/CoxI family protein [Bacillota bacterium]|nr:XdhC/CoxI family protein [Bacillota bacterium]